MEKKKRGKTKGGKKWKRKRETQQKMEEVERYWDKKEEKYKHNMKNAKGRKEKEKRKGKNEKMIEQE